MAIPGWTGATRIVDGVGECPYVQLHMPYGDPDRAPYVAITEITADKFIARGDGEGLMSFDRRTARIDSNGFFTFAIGRRYSDIAALNALADAQPDGTWRATPDDDTEERER